jgi:DNA-binding HxlR family transcriptional regulator
VSQKSESTNLGGPRACSIADALDLVGERWSLLILRALRVWGETYVTPNRGSR